MKYSVIVPVYNSNESLVELKQLLDEVLVSDFEIIFVNDGSSNPETRSTLDELTGPNIKVHHHGRNLGKPHAQLSGFRLAEGDYIINMDDDLEHDPYELPKLLARKDEYDVVSAKLDSKNRSLFRKIVSKMRKGVESKRVDQRISPYRVVRRSVIQRMLADELSHPYIPSLLSKHASSTVEIEVNRGVRKYGRSSFTLFKLARAYFNLVSQD